MTTVFIVMDGNYEPSLDSVFSTESAAKRRAAALREGYSYSIELDMLAAEDYCYQVDYMPDDDLVLVWLASEDGTSDTECDEEGYCRTYVRAKTHDEAERLGKAKILGYLGKEQVAE